MNEHNGNYKKAELNVLLNILRLETQLKHGKTEELGKLFCDEVGTEQWLLDTCLTTIDDYLQSSINAPAIIAKMQEILDRNEL